MSPQYSPYINESFTFTDTISDVIFRLPLFPLLLSFWSHSLLFCLGAPRSGEEQQGNGPGVEAFIRKMIYSKLVTIETYTAEVLRTQLLN